jgi:hypothetical protein
MTSFDRAWKIAKEIPHQLKHPPMMIRKPINDPSEAIDYLIWLHNSNWSYHYDDDPIYGVVMSHRDGEGGRTTTDWPNAITEMMSERHREMWDNINPWTVLEDFGFWEYLKDNRDGDDS